MATYTIYTPTSDGRVIQENNTTEYSKARTTGGTLSVADTYGNDLDVGQVRGTASSYYACYEGFVQFDTSSVTGTVLSATLEIYGDTDWDGVGGWTVNVRDYDWGTGLTTADWISGENLSNYTLRATLASNSFTTSGYNTFTSESTFKDNVANPVRLVLSSSRMEAGTAPAQVSSSGDSKDERLLFKTADTAGTTYDPKLTIVTEDISPVFVNMAPRIPAEAY